MFWRTSITDYCKVVIPETGVQVVVFAGRILRGARSKMESVLACATCRPVLPLPGTVQTRSVLLRSHHAKNDMRRKLLFPALLLR